MVARKRGGECVAGWALVWVGLLVLAGCRSSGSRSCGDGCGGGCCRGQSQETSVALRTSERSPLSASPPAATRLAEAGTVAAAARPYGGQARCPVTGDELGSMGPAVPVSVKGRTVYVCCRGCVAKVQRDPDTYLAKVEAERAGR